MEIGRKIDLHNGERRNFTSQKRLENSNLHKENKEAIKRFIISISTSENLSPGREAKLTDELRRIATVIGRKFSKITKKDAEKFIMWLHKESKLAEDTQQNYRMIFKRFMRWYWIELKKFEDNGDKHSYPKEISWIHDPKKEYNRNGITREVLLEEKDIIKIISACREPMWRAMLWVLWEGGLRPGELLNLRVRDCETTDFGMRINIRFGKTGARKLPLVQAKQSLLIWLENHSKKEQPDALLFPISYVRSLMRVNAISKRAGIVGKMTSLKYWRKARATFLAKSMTQNQLMYWFGWQNAKTSNAYVYACEKDILPAVLKLNKIANVEADGTIVKFKICIKCSERNDDDREKCMRCGFALTPEALQKFETENTEKQRQVVREELTRIFTFLKSQPDEVGKNILDALDGDDIKKFTENIKDITKNKSTN